MGWQIADIRTKIRAVTGRPSTDQITDAQLNNYINNYYVFTMPFELKEQIEESRQETEIFLNNLYEDIASAKFDKQQVLDKLVKFRA